MSLIKRWKGGAVALAGIAAVVGTFAVAQAQAPATFTMAVTENRAPGAAGQSTITPLGNSQARVDIRITGLPPGEQRAAHIHTAPGAVCDTNSPVTYPLTNVAVDAAGVGTSTTTITLTADKPVQANNAYVNVHQGNVGAGAPAGVGVICANVTQSYVAGAAIGQGAAVMPRTGTGGIEADSTGAWVIAGLAGIAVLLAGSGSLAFARRKR